MYYLHVGQLAIIYGRLQDMYQFISLSIYVGFFTCCNLYVLKYCWEILLCLISGYHEDDFSSPILYKCYVQKYVCK